MLLKGFLKKDRFVVSQTLKLKRRKLSYSYTKMSQPSEEGKTYIAAFGVTNCAVLFCKIIDLRLQTQAATGTLDCVL